MHDDARLADSSEFGRLLRRHRLNAGLSQEALAERAQMSPFAISALERGYRRRPQRATLTLLATALALSDAQREDLEATAARVGVPVRSNAVTPGPWPNSRPTNLPLGLTNFIGRKAEIAAIAGLIKRHRLVTLVGSGGVGKTRLSLEVAPNLFEDFGDGVWFVELAPLSKGEYISAAVAQALGIVLPAEGDPVENLSRALTGKEMFLLFDNCEHLIETAACVISSILHTAPKIKVLATSRQGLGIAGEAVHQVPCLAFPSDGAAVSTLNEVLGYESVALFVERALAASDSFSLPDENARAVAEICRRLDGIPLAIELAAARVKMLSPQQLRDRLDERFRLLTGGGRDVLPRHQTLRALIDWSYDLLDERERGLFRRLGIFANGFALEGAFAVGSGDRPDEFELFNVLASLVDKSLVLAELDGEVVRYRLLETTRAYALEKLTVAGEHDVVSRLHLHYLSNIFAARLTESERTGRTADLIGTLQTELEDVRAALDGALARSETLDGAELLANIDRIWRDIGLETEGITRCEAYLAALPEDGARLRARLSSVLSWLLSDSYRKIRAFDVATQAVEQARASDDAATLARALAYYALAATFLHRFDDAEKALGEAEAIPIAWPSIRIVLLDTRAHLHRFRGDLESAASMFAELRNEHRSIGNPGTIPSASLAEVEHARGNTTRAIAIVRDTLPAVRSGADKRTLATLLVNLAGYLVAVDDLPGAVAAAREAIEIRAAREPDRVGVAVACEHVALVFASWGSLARAAVLEAFANAAFARNGYLREFTEKATFDRLDALLREGIPRDDLALLSAEGGDLTPEAAIALALAPDIEVTRSKGVT